MSEHYQLFIKHSQSTASSDQASDECPPKANDGLPCGGLNRRQRVWREGLNLTDLELLIHLRLISG